MFVKHKSNKSGENLQLHVLAHHKQLNNCFPKWVPWKIAFQTDPENGVIT